MEKDPNSQGRRAASRATKLRRRKARMNFILLADPPGHLFQCDGIRSR